MGPKGILPRALRALSAATAVIFLFSACGEKEKKQKPPPPPTATTLEWAVDPVRLDALEATAQLEVVVKDQDENPMEDQEILWATSDERIVEVDESGLVTARANGKAEITASVGEELQIRLPVEVEQLAVTAAVEPKALTLDAVDAEAKLEVVVRDRNGFVIEAAEVVWRSEDEGVATVDKDGQVRAVAAGSAEVRARVEGTEAADAVTVTVTPLPVELALGIFPETFVAGAPTEVVVQVTDANGHPVVGAAHKVSLALGENHAGGRLSGTKAVNAVDGVATFADLSIDRAGAGYTLLAWVEGLGEVESPVFEVRSAPAARLAFVGQPQRGVSGEELAAFEIQVQDASGNLVADATHSVTLALQGGAPGATLTGDPVFEAVGGRVTVRGLSVDLAANDYFFEASADGLGAATSRSFAVVPGAPARLAFLGQPSDTVSRATISPAVLVEILDAAGNRVTNSTLPVAVALNPASGGLKGLLGVNAVGGVATFSNLSVDQAGSYTLLASSGALASPASAAFEVRAGNATRLTFHHQPPASVRSGAAMSQVSVRALDAAGNFADTASGVVTVSLGQNPGAGKLSGTLSANLVNGEATFDNLRLDKAGSGYTLRATAAGMGAAESNGLEVTPGDPAKLAFLQQPRAADAGANLAPAVQVEILDAAGNRVRGASDAVSLSLAQNPAGGSLVGGGAVNAVDGVATFAGLQIAKAGAGYTLRASAGALVEAESGAFDIRAASASKLVVLTEPQNGVAGSTLAPIRFEIQDASGNLVPGASHAVTVALTNPNGATLSGSRTVSASNGVATFSTLSIDKASEAAAPYVLQATAAGLGDVLTAPFSVAAGAPARLHFHVQPGDGVSGAALGEQPVVHVLDASGNLATSANEQVTLTLGQKPAGGSLSGTFSVAAVNGVATFTNLSVDKAGAGYTLRASAQGIAGAESATFHVTHGSVSQLAFRTQPSHVAAGAPTAVEVSLLDAAGNLVESATDLVTLSLGQNPGGSVLDGTLAVAASGGVARFNDLSLNKVAQGYTLRAELGASTAESTGFDVRAGAADHLAFLVQPADGKAGAALEPAVQVEIHDAHDNRVVAGSHVVQLTLLNAAGATLGGNLSVASVGGVATFHGLHVDRMGAGYQLQASVEGLTSADSDPFRIDAAAPAKLAFRTQPPATLTSEEDFLVEVEVLDAKGNLAEDAQGIVKLALGQRPAGASLAGTLVANIVDGVATFSGISVAKAASGYTLHASATGLSGVESEVFTVAAGEPAGLAFRVQPSDFASGGTMAAVQVEIRDGAGNRVHGVTDVVTLALGQNPGSGSLSGASALGTAAVDGVATFSDLSIDKAGQGYTLVASSGSLNQGESAAFQVRAGSASKLVFSVQPQSTTADDLLAPVWVEIRDDADNLVETATDAVTLSLATHASGGSLAGNTTVNAVAGVARFSGLSVKTAGEGYELVASSGSLAQGTSLPFDVVAGGAAKLAFVDVEETYRATQVLNVRVEVRDSGDNLVEDANLPVTLALGSNPGGALQGTRIVQTVNGVATFDAAWINERGSGYTLRAFSGALLMDESTAFEVIALPTAVAFVSVPAAAVVAGEDFLVEVEVLDELGDRMLGEELTVDLRLTDGTPLVGATSAQTVDGLATFGPAIEKAGEGYVLEAVAAGLIADTSAPIDVVPAAPAELVVLDAPALVVSEALFDVHLRLVDAFGNAVSGATVEIADYPELSNLVDGVPPGGLVTDAQGEVRFEDLSIGRAGTWPILAFSDTVWVEELEVEVEPGPVVTVIFLSAPAAPVKAGAPFDLEVFSFDNAGNYAPRSGQADWRVYLNGDPSPIDSGAEPVTEGKLSMSSFQTLVGSYRYEIEIDGVQASTEVVIVPGSVDSLKWIVHPEDRQAGDPLNELEFHVVDAYGNRVLGVSGVVWLYLMEEDDLTWMDGTHISSDLIVDGVIIVPAGLVIEKAGTHRLLASGHADVFSNEFTITPGPVGGLQFAVQPPAQLDLGEEFSVAVRFDDAYGNFREDIEGEEVVLTLSCLDPAVDFPVDVTLAATSEAGVATFSALRVEDDAICRIVAEAAGFGVDGSSASFDVGATALTPNVVEGLKFLRLPAGEHLRCPTGSPEVDDCDDGDVIVSLRGFWMMETEVTAAAYDACITEGSCTPTSAGADCTSGVPGKEDHPINCVSFEQAEAFCGYLGGSLPGLDQWAYAAKGGQETTWPWGDDEPVFGIHAHFNDPVGSTMAVGQHPAGVSHWGLHDLVGNVEEFVHVPDVPDYLSKGTIGGSFQSLDNVLLLHLRGWALGMPASTQGFRCVMD